MPFNQMVTFPAELSLRSTTEGIRLCANPIKEIELLHIKAEFELGARHSYGVFGLVLNGFEIEYDARHNRLNDAFLDIENGKICLEILMDRTSVEIYANHGRLYLSDPHTSVDHPKQLRLYSLWGDVHLSNLQIYELESIWN